MYEKMKHTNYPQKDWIVLRNEQLARLKGLIPHWLLVDLLGAIIMWIPLLIANDMLNSGYNNRLDASHGMMLFLALQGLALGLLGAGLQILAIIVMKGRVKRLYCKILLVMWGLIAVIHYVGLMMPTPDGAGGIFSIPDYSVPYSAFSDLFLVYMLLVFPMTAVFGIALIVTLVIRIKAAIAR